MDSLVGLIYLTSRCNQINSNFLLAHDNFCMRYFQQKFEVYNSIRIYHEGGVEKICPDDHHLASKGMLSDDKR